MPQFNFASLEKAEKQGPEPSQKNPRKEKKEKSESIKKLESKVENQQFTIDYLQIELKQLKEHYQINQEKEQIPDLYDWVEEIASYIKKHNIKSFNANDPKFRTTQIEKILAIIKDQYKGQMI